MRLAVTTLAVSVLAVPWLAGQTVDTNNAAQAQEEKEVQLLGQFFRNCFDRWCHNSSGLLRLQEVDAVIANPQARGNEAAAAVLLHRRLSAPARGGTNGISAEELQALASDPESRRRFFQLRNHIWYVNRTAGRTLFMPKDPNFLSFHQGRMEDCYFLAVVGDMVCRDAPRMRSLITEHDGAYVVSFPGGRSVSVPFLSDAELVMGASVGADHGVWLSVLEKAFGLLRKANREERQREDTPAGAAGSASARPAIIADIMGRGGASAPVIALFTGHRVSTVRLDHWIEEDGVEATNRLHQLLVELTGAKRLITTSVGRRDAAGATPGGIIRNHVFGVLRYKPAEQSVMVFNPWGNSFTPKGQAGLVNGYPTRFGLFEVPLGDFIRIFTHLDYETEEPLVGRF